MNDTMQILIAGRSQAALAVIKNVLQEHPEFNCTIRVISNGHADPLHGIERMPDVLVLRFDPNNLAEITALAESDPASRPPLIIVGPSAGAEAIRMAMRSGAKDMLLEPLQEGELIDAIERIRQERRRKVAQSTGQIQVVVGAAGGVGSTFIACNLAHLTATVAQRSCLLVDLDTSYAPVTHFLDLKPERGLLEALEELETLDEFALQGYICKHRSGLHVMASIPRAVMFSRDLPAERLGALLRLLSTQYQYVVVDSPHHVDKFNATAFDMARSILIVLEQSVLHAKNAARMLSILTRELDVPRDRIRIVLNRYDKRSNVQVEDIQRVLDSSSVVTIPNHYKLAMDSIDTATPLLDISKDAAVVRRLVALQEELAGVTREARTGLLSRLQLFSRR